MVLIALKMTLAKLKNIFKKNACVTYKLSINNSTEPELQITFFYGLFKKITVQGVDIFKIPVLISVSRLLKGKTPDH